MICAVWFISPVQYGFAVWFISPVQYGSYHLCNLVPITWAVWFLSPVQYGLYHLCHFVINMKDQSPVGCVLVPADGQV